MCCSTRGDRLLWALAVFAAVVDRAMAAPAVPVVCRKRRRLMLPRVDSG